MTPDPRPHGKLARDLFDAIAAQPWSTAGELADIVGTYPTNANHALLRLVQSESIVRVGAAPYRYVLPAAAPKDESPAHRELEEAHLAFDVLGAPRLEGGRTLSLLDRLGWLTMREPLAAK